MHKEHLTLLIWDQQNHTQSELEVHQEPEVQQPEVLEPTEVSEVLQHLEQLFV